MINTQGETQTTETIEGFKEKYSYLYEYEHREHSRILKEFAYDVSMQKNDDPATQDMRRATELARYQKAILSVDNKVNDLFKYKDLPEIIHTPTAFGQCKELDEMQGNGFEVVYITEITNRVINEPQKKLYKLEKKK